jgi:phosphohistidine phosphatase
MRHAKSDWAADYESDHDRPLNPRGVEAAGQMGRLLTDLGQIPDMVISSTALRARSTAELTARAGGWGLDVILEPKFYGTGPETVLEIVRRVDGAGRLLIVGHQPTWGMIVRALTGEPVEMKTATVALVELPVDSWSDVAAGTLVGLHHPSR